MTNAILSSLIHFPLVIAAIVIFFKIIVAGDSRLVTARNTALLLLIFELMAVLLHLGIGTQLNYISLVSSDILFFLKTWVMVYVGQLLWEKTKGDYWGIPALKKNPRMFIYGGLTAVVVMIVYTNLLFSITQPSEGPLIKLLDGEKDPAHGLQKLALMIIVFANFAIVEEFIYRGCFQSMFNRWFGSSGFGTACSILCTSLIWTFAHSGTLQPDWVKYMQILPLGLFLSYWFIRFGFLGTASVHLAFNLLIIPFAETLIIFD